MMAACKNYIIHIEQNWNYTSNQQIQYNKSSILRQTTGNSQYGQATIVQFLTSWK